MKFKIGDKILIPATVIGLDPGEETFSVRFLFDPNLFSHHMDKVNPDLVTLTHENPQPEKIILPEYEVGPELVKGKVFENDPSRTEESEFQRKLKEALLKA